VFKSNKYAGVQLTYTFLNVNDSVVPTKGISFFADATLSHNITQKEFFQKYFIKFQAYFPFSNKFSLAVRGGAATVAGNTSILNNAQFYEHAVIGGPQSLRGFKRERFWGKTSFYNNNELRFITDVRTILFNAKAGLLLFFDDGRVWMPHENSSMVHTGYGAGFLFAPFNKISATVTYGTSKESSLIQVRLNTLF
jgi:outer membrane protein assembly factor BamA